MLPFSSDMCHDVRSSETTDEETLHYLQQRVKELSAENKELRDIADTEKAKVTIENLVSTCLNCYVQTMHEI